MKCGRLGPGTKRARLSDRIQSGPYCGVRLHADLAQFRDDKIVRVDSPIESSVTHGSLCIKGRFGWQFVQIRANAKGKRD